MPLSHGKSKEAISKNIKTEVAAGKPQDQAVAIALNTAREAGAHIPNKADGGVIEKPEQTNVQHDSDAVKSYLASKFHNLMSPTEQTPTQPPPSTGISEAETPKKQAEAIDPRTFDDKGLEHPAFDPIMLLAGLAGPAVASGAKSIAGEAIPLAGRTLANEAGSIFPKNYFLNPSNKGLIGRAEDMGLSDVENHELTPNGLITKAKELLEAGDLDEQAHLALQQSMAKFGKMLPSEIKPIKMAGGGYPHVTFLENVSTPEMKKTVHLEDPSGAHGDKITTGHEENYAEGGTIHKAKGRDKEPAKPADINMSHEEKLNSIYKAMGIKGYANGGPVVPAQVGPTVGVPNPNDPSYWDQIKAALAKVSAPITSVAGAPIPMIEGAAKMAAPLIPPAVSAINKLTGASLPVPASPAPQTADLGTPTPLSAPMPPALPPTPQAAPTIPAGGGGAPADLKTLFNQDTSKLTEGVNAEDRQALAGKMEGQQHGLGSMVAEAISGLGDAIAAKGGREQHSLKDIFSMQKQQRDEALANFDKARQDRLEKLDLQTKMGNNTIQKLAAQDAYGVDEHLNKQLGAPPGTLHKDLPLYMQMMTAKAAQSEKDSDLYMKAHAQAANEVEGAVKSAGMFNVKPSPAQLQASGSKLADQYYNRAKGNVLFQPSDGQKPVWIPAQNVQKAKQMDPHGQIVP